MNLTTRACVAVVTATGITVPLALWCGRPTFVDTAAGAIGRAAGRVAARMIDKPYRPPVPPAPVKPPGPWASEEEAARAEMEFRVVCAEWDALRAKNDALLAQIAEREERIRHTEERTAFLIQDAWIYVVAMFASVLTMAIFARLPRRGTLDGHTRCGQCGGILKGLTEPRCAKCGCPL